LHHVYAGSPQRLDPRQHCIAALSIIAALRCGIPRMFKPQAPAA